MLDLAYIMLVWHHWPAGRPLATPLPSGNSNLFSFDSLLLVYLAIGLMIDGPFRKLNDSAFRKVMPNGDKSERHWLLYSPSTGRIFFFVCKLFVSNSTSSLSNKGYDSWDHRRKVWGAGGLAPLDLGEEVLPPPRFLVDFYIFRGSFCQNS